MAISLKCQYGLRAMLELAARENQGLIRLTEIAAAQNIPARFLENILNQMRQGCFISSRRGKDGGFVLEREARDIRIGEIIRFFEGALHPLEAPTNSDGEYHCGDFVFNQLWRDAEKALLQVYNQKTLRDLLEEENHAQVGAVDSYCI
ncbi:AsnC family transcriptional regulator [Planctomycetales bacterium]|nr:AsnC family transcriptional regulator [Planctomycetales bacterium]